MTEKNKDLGGGWYLVSELASAEFFEFLLELAFFDVL
jgi:hypothetical protein